MASAIPQQTINVFARSILQAARGYGFSQIDTVRLINALLDLSTQDGGNGAADTERKAAFSVDDPRLDVEGFPLRSHRLSIRPADASRDAGMLESWLDDKYGKHFILSCATAQLSNPQSLLRNPANKVGIILLGDDRPIGAMAFLDYDEAQRRAELRKLIGAPDARGQGYAEEATVLWLKYGIERLGLEKVYVSTLQNHLQNIELNERVGFRIEGVLIGEVLIDGERQDVLRMGFCRRGRG